jgi:ATP-binding cassette subfamily B protein
MNNINLNIKKGDKFLIYGKSGNGKSTLMKILLKYFDEYKGIIKINDINLKDISRDTIRNSFSYVSQNEILLSDTIKNNIVLKRDISDKKYNEIIKICKVNEIIDKKPLRGNFLIEEDGFNLSGGERQKIILARGLLKKFNILILDEALSEVGLEEELKIMKEIFKKYSDKTIIYISHKKEIISYFEKKYLFEEKGEK